MDKIRVKRNVNSATGEILWLVQSMGGGKGFTTFGEAIKYADSLYMSVKYVKLPIEVEALQYTGEVESASQVIDWVLSGGGRAKFWCEDESCDGSGALHDLFIDTLEGEMTVVPGAWVIKGVKGEFYPCRQDIFEETYEEVKP